MKNLILFICFCGSFSDLLSQNNWKWAMANDSGITSVSSVYDMAYDSNGNVIITGNFSDTLSLKSSTLASTGGSDCFTASLTKNGAVNWVRKAGGGNADYGNSVCTDNSGNIYIAGVFSNSLVAGNTTLTTSTAGMGLFLMKYNTTGQLLWAKKMGEGSSYRSVLKTRNGILYLFASMMTSGAVPASIGQHTLSVAGAINNTDILLARLDTAGNFIAATQFGGTKDEVASGLAITNTGHIVLTGPFTSSVLTFGTYTLTGSSNNHFSNYIVKTDSIGNVIWAKVINKTGGYTYVSADNSGNIGVAGDFVSPAMSIDSHTLTRTAATRNAMVIRLDPSGNIVWIKQIGGPTQQCDEGCHGVTFDNVGNMYTTGFYSSPILTVGSHTLNNSQGTNVFIAKYDATGNVSKMYNLGGTGAWTMGYCLLADNTGDLQVAGYFYGSVLSPGTHTVYGNQNFNPMFFLARTGDGTTGLSDLQELRSVLVYPNPTSSAITIRSENALIKVITILDISGREIFNQRHEGHEIKLLIDELPNGAYLLQIQTSDSRISFQKIIKSD